MPKFREKQPVVEIDAVQWRGDNRDEVCAWLDACPNVRYHFDEAGGLILTWNYGTRRDRDVDVGCWIYDSDDNICITKNDAFIADYEPVGWVEDPFIKLDVAGVDHMVIADMQRRYKSTASVSRSIAARVIEDMHERDRVGRERYGKPLTVDNGRDQLVDAYQEILDASVYTRAAMAEGTLVPEAVYNNLLDSLVTVRRLIDMRAETATLVGGAE